MSKVASLQRLLFGACRYARGYMVVASSTSLCLCVCVCSMHLMWVGRSSAHLGRCAHVRVRAYACASSAVPVRRGSAFGCVCACVPFCTGVSMARTEEHARAPGDSMCVWLRACVRPCAQCSSRCGHAIRPRSVRIHGTLTLEAMETAAFAFCVQRYVRVCMRVCIRTTFCVSCKGVCAEHREGRLSVAPQFRGLAGV